MIRESQYERAKARLEAAGIVIQPYWYTPDGDLFADPDEVQS